MTVKAKIMLLTTITTVMGLSYIILTVLNTPIAAKIILAAVWLCHIVYFGVIVKTVKE